MTAKKNPQRAASMPWWPAAVVVIGAGALIGGIAYAAGRKRPSGKRRNGGGRIYFDKDGDESGRRFEAEIYDVGEGAEEGPWCARFRSWGGSRAAPEISETCSDDFDEIQDFLRDEYLGAGVQPPF